MELDAKAVFSVLTRKGVTALYHANSVRTACSFLSAGKLLSRGMIEQIGLAQTPQKSDDIDRRYGVWFDIFLDAVDIHETAKTCNWYGPVLFVLDLNLLKSIPTICVTKKDPLKWMDSDKPEDRFIQSVKELDATYIPGDLDKMFVIRCLGGTLLLQGVLKEIVLDDPDLGSDNRLYVNAREALRLSAKGSAMGDLAIVPRRCRRDCPCHGEYQGDVERAGATFAR